MRKKIDPLLFIGIIGTCVIGSHFAAHIGRATWGNRDIWWTPRAMQLSLDEARDRFEVLLSGELLQDHIDRGSLSATDKNGERYRVVPEDVGVRLNNWQTAKASFLNAAVFSGFALGVSVACLAIGLARRWSNRPAATPAPEPPRMSGTGPVSNG